MRKETDDSGGSGAGLSTAMGDRRQILSGAQTFNSFKNPIYRLYFLGMLGQMASMNMEMMSRTLLIYRLTGSAAILGAMSLANALPMLFLSLFGGVIADRMQKKYVLIAGQVSQAVVALGVALALTSNYLSPERAGSWWILVVAGMLKGSIQGLMMPSRQAIIREIVNEEQLMNAVALNTLGQNTLRLLAPAMSGFLIDAIGFEAVYYVMAGLFAVAAIFFSFMPLTGTITIRGSGALADIKEGFHYIRRETTILFILIFTLIAVVLSMPYMTLLPVFAVDVLKVGASGQGMLLSISGAGAIAGSLVLASLPNKKRGGMLLVSVVVLGLALAGFSFSGSWYPSLILMVFVGLGQAGRMTLSNALLQYYTPEEYQGRVMSIYMMEFGLTSFGTFSAALLAESMGVQWAVGGFAIVLVFLAILTIVFVPRIRKLD
ncbi:MAG: MFS transporter [Chloroflexi bacterium]|nr:MFS transporter [Chloroflexota bacterium]MBI2979890.1 MFS transporter [Chloroflexota bacterium]